MSHAFWRRFAWQPVALVGGALILSLILLPSFSAAQEEQSAEPDVSEEVKTEVEEDLTPSADAAKESSVDLKAELDLPADYDPVVPDSFFNSVRYNFKKLGRNVKEGWYNTFASDQAHAAVVKDYADKELVEASKLASLDPGNQKVANILDKYQSHVVAAKDKLELIKTQNPEFAKEFSAKLAEDNLFVAPIVLNNLQENFLATNPNAVPGIIRAREAVLGAAGHAVVAAAANETEAAETLKIIAQKSFRTPFSGIAAADVLAQTQQALPDISPEFRNVFDQVIKTSLATVEENLKNLEASDETKATIFQKYVEQLPGQSVNRMKVIDQFKGQADLPPIMIAKMQEIKARLAENLSTRIEAVVNEEVRKAMTEGIMQFKNPGIHDFKVLSEVADLVPSEEIRKEITRKHDEGVAKFLGKFGDDAHARQVTEEFQTITRKVQNGELAPDANFFKTLDGLKQRLAPDQQQFIDEMETAGRNEMASRMQTDPAFAQRFATFNPADTAVFDELKLQFDPSQIPNFNQKFAEIEQSQADNFRRHLDVQNDPERVRHLQQRFTSEVPDAIKQRFEQNYRFNEGEFRKHEENAREKEEFFRHKRQELEQQYREKFGESFPGQGPGHFPGQPGFGFPGQGFGVGGTPPAFQPDQNISCPAGTQKTEFGCEVPFQRQQFDPQIFCTQKGGTFANGFCQFQGPGFDQAPETQQRISDPQASCAAVGGTWTGTFCKFESGASSALIEACVDNGGVWIDNSCKSPEFESRIENFPTPDPVASCREKGGTWTGSYCQFQTTQPRTDIQPLPTTIDPARACAEKGGHWTGSFCEFPQTNIQPPAIEPAPTNTFDPARACAEKGGTWTGSFCQFPTTQPTTQQVQGISIELQPDIAQTLFFLLGLQ